MREIKFRGWFQGINNQEYWAYGYLVKQTNGNWEITNGETSWTVDNIGQFTGLLDKKSKDIYEFDIVRYINPYSNKTFIHVVKFEESFACFSLFESVSDKFAKESDWVKIIEIEVIGNIYENPELLTK